MSGKGLGKPTDGIVSRYLNRRVSGWITSQIIKYNIGITPTQVSFISFFLGLLSALLYIYGEIVLAGFLIQFSSIIDGVDGELARARNMVSKRGGFIDTLLDRLVNIAVLSTLTIFLLERLGYDVWILLICILALSADLLVTYLHAVSQKDLGIHPALVGAIPPIASRDVRLFIIFLASILGVLDLNYIVYGLAVLAGLTFFYIFGKFIELVKYIDRVSLQGSSP